jgi:hypothetical protein
MSGQVSITTIPKEIEKAITLINKFLKLNKLKINFKVNIDYSLDSYGEFDPSKRFEFTVNPDKFHYYPESEANNAAGFTYDRTLLGVCIHEFCHLVDEQLGLEQLYRAEFKEKLILNHYCEDMWCEEMAEVFMLFITNPYLLKHIDDDRFDFFGSMFKSPTKCSEASFKAKYRLWTKGIKRICRDLWGIHVYKNQIVKS